MKKRKTLLLILLASLSGGLSGQGMVEYALVNDSAGAKVCQSTAEYDPVSDSVHVQACLTEAGPVSITHYDNAGHGDVVFSDSLQAGTRPVGYSASGYTMGVYIVYIEKPQGESEAIRIIINR